MKTAGASGIAPPLGDVQILNENVPADPTDPFSFGTSGLEAFSILLPLVETDDPARITSITMRLGRSTDSTDRTIRAAVWADDGGQPGDLLLQSGALPETQIPVGDGIYPTTFGFANAPLPAGTYHVGLFASATGPSINIGGGGTASSLAPNTAATTPAGPWSDRPASTMRTWFQLRGILGG